MAGAASASDSTDDGSLSDEDQALQQAQSSGQPVEVVSARTELSDEWANPDGTFSVKRYGSPVRVFRGGAWVPTDPTLVFAADGSVVPKAATVAVTFSGGGSGPLLSGVKDGRTLTLSWPTALPVPTLDGNVATYSEILPGVDLQLKAEVEGFSQLIVVKNAAAAQNPALAALRYTMSTVGLSVATDPDTGTVAATDPAGQSVFTSPSPLMWDSTTRTSDGAATSGSTKAARSTPSSQSITAAEATDDTGNGGDFEPPPGAQDAQMPTAVSGNTLTITPDQSLLTGATTQYPVYIDPSWAWGVRQNWTRVYRKYPNNSYWNANEVARVGYENETNGLSRSFFQWDTSGIKNAAVVKSTFRIKNTWSWSCQSREVQLWQTGPITRTTTWNHQPAKIGTAPLAKVNDAKGWGSACPAGNLEFDLTSKIKDAAAHANSSVTLGLYAADESDTFGWKKFDPKTAVLETQFNNAPNAPGHLGTNPKTDCANGGLIGNTTVTLHATVDDKDAGNLTARFQVFKSGSSTAVVDKTIPGLNHRVSTLQVPDTSLPTGTYTWKVNATDPMNATSAWSRTCTFSVDRTRPAKPPVINSTTFPDGANGWPANTGKARTTGTFTLAPNGVTDVAEYGWYTDYDPQVTYVGVFSDHTGSAKATPPGFGPHFFYAFSVDAAGNRSDTATYIYYAAGSGVRDVPGDLNGDGNNDIWNVDSNGTLLTYAGQNNSQFSAATNGGQAFDGAQVASRGDWGQDGYNDLLVLQPGTTGGKELDVYPNNGSGIATTTGVDGGEQELTVACPAVVDPTDDNPDGCATADDHWHDAAQIIAPGDINGDGAPDLLAKEGTLLWAYYGDRATKRLDMHGAPVLVGGNDWNKFTVIAPGDLNGDGYADLLLRDNATGDIYRTYGKQGENAGVVNPATWGDTASRVKIATGIPASAYPAVGSSGDVTGDGIPDVWGRKADNTMTGWPGKKTGADWTGLGTAFTIDGITGGARIPANTTIASGVSFTSRSAKLTMQSDGNLVITNNSNTVVWSTRTGGNPGATAVMQPDGNLVVYKPDGSSALWASNTQYANGYALLQDRGNLVIYNVKGQAQWSSGTVARHDYNGDGRSDIAAWYDYVDGHDGMHTIMANSDGSLAQPFASYTSQVGSWNATSMKYTTGDYNGDGRADAAMLVDYGSGTAKIFTALARADGGFNNPVVAWSSKANSWWAVNMTLHSGDFNGDGRDDIAVWYAFSDGGDTLFTFTANVNGLLNAPTASFSSDTDAWKAQNIKFVTGDFNGDGRDDIAGLANYSDAHVTMFTWLANPAGGFQTPFSSWTSATWGDWNRTYVYPGDFNGDGQDDIALWYDYADGHDTTFTATSSGGHFGTPAQAWTAPAGAYTFQNLIVVAGDYNGDGRADLAAMGRYPVTDTRPQEFVRMFTWTAKTTSTGFNDPLTGWTSTPGNWYFTQTHLFDADS